MTRNLGPLLLWILLLSSNIVLGQPVLEELRNHLGNSFEKTILSNNPDIDHFSSASAITNKQGYVFASDTFYFFPKAGKLLEQNKEAIIEHPIDIQVPNNYQYPKTIFNGKYILTYFIDNPTAYADNKRSAGVTLNLIDLEMKRRLYARTIHPDDKSVDLNICQVHLSENGEVFVSFIPTKGQNTTFKNHTGEVQFKMVDLYGIPKSYSKKLTEGEKVVDLSITNYTAKEVITAIVYESEKSDTPEKIITYHFNEERTDIIETNRVEFKPSDLSYQGFDKKKYRDLKIFDHIVVKDPITGGEVRIILERMLTGLYTTSNLDASSFYMTKLFILSYDKDGLLNWTQIQDLHYKLLFKDMAQSHACIYPYFNKQNELVILMNDRLDAYAADGSYLNQQLKYHSHSFKNSNVAWMKIDQQGNLIDRRIYSDRNERYLLRNNLKQGTFNIEHLDILFWEDYEFVGSIPVENIGTKKFAVKLSEQ